MPVLKQTAPLSGSGIALADQSNMAFMGTVVTRGRGLGRVVATGMKTVVGGIAQLIQDHSEQSTPLQERLDHLGKILIVICIATCLLVMALGLYRGENLMRMILTGISLAVAAVPEGHFMGERGRGNPLDHQGIKTLIEIELLCNNSVLDREGGQWILQGDPTEGALMALAKKAGVAKKGKC